MSCSHTSLLGFIPAQFMQRKMSKHTADGEYNSSAADRSRWIKDVLSRLGEVQKMNREGINQADVQSVGKSSYPPRPCWPTCILVLLKHNTINAVTTSVTYYYWNICFNAVFSFSSEGVKVWSDPFKSAGKWFLQTSTFMSACACECEWVLYVNK